MENKIEEFLNEIDLLDDKCDKIFRNVHGSLKLRKKLEQEKKFLSTVKIRFIYFKIRFTMLVK